MNAAKTSSPEAVDLLLKKDPSNGVKVPADPNLTDENGVTALAFSFATNNTQVINTLAEVTTEAGEATMKMLAQADVKIDGELETFVKKMLNDGQKVKLLQLSTFFGNSLLMDYLLNKANITWTENNVLANIENVIKSDDAKACKIFKDYCKQIYVQIEKEKIEDLLKMRGKTEILDIFGVQYSQDEAAEKILKDIPKFEEFPYCEVMDEIRTLVKKFNPSLSANEKEIDFKTLLAKLHVPIVHYHEDCEEDCGQKMVCGRVRDVIELLKQILNLMSDKFPIFKGVSTIVVGSLKEQTKIGEIDEADIVLALNETFNQNQLNFDKEKQKIMVRKYFYDRVSKSEWDFAQKKELLLPEELKLFVSDVTADEEYYGHIDTKKYFFTFMEEFYKIIQSGRLKLPYGLTLSTQFTPCRVCKNTDYTIAQYVRCKHKPDCQEHLKRLDDPNYKEDCSCKIYTSPCLSFTKIGLVLHLEFVNEDGSVLNMDVDVNPPSFPVSNRRYDDGKSVNIGKFHAVEETDYDGSNTKKKDYLAKNRQVGWKTEWRKSEDMSAAASPGDKLRRAVRLRFFNNQEVLAERSLLFYKPEDGDKTGGTLSGNKKKVYVLLKIMKKIFNADITSFKV